MYQVNNDGATWCAAYSITKAEIMRTHERSISDKVFEVWRSPGRFTKNPDIIALPSGRLMLVYCDNDAHWSLEQQIITLLASDDQGKTWFKFKKVASADLRVGDERFATPRLSRLNDGRLVILIDHDDFGHFHEDQPSGNWAYWSEDEGHTWSEPQVTGIPGFEPDRMIDLPDGRLAVISQLMRGDTQEFAVVLWCSEDRGKIWYEAATVAHDGYHRFCEGALVLLDGGKELACVMRENHSAGFPSFVVFSGDMGKTWSGPQMMPFAFHRPYAKQLVDGRTLVTGRHVNGGLGTYAWCGDLKHEPGYQIGGPRRKFSATLSDEALVIEHKPEHDCRYTLLPPESSKSEIQLEAEVKVEGPAGQAVAFLSLCKLRAFASDGVVLAIGSDFIAHSRSGPDFHKRIDMTRYRTVSIHHRRGLLQISVDGEPLINQCVFREEQPLADFWGASPEKRTQFGQYSDVGRSFWKRVAYHVVNPVQEDFHWSWRASDGQWPDEYQRRRLIQIHANHPDQQPWPDNGYSSWLQLNDGRIMFVDYTNCNDTPNTAHLVGAFIDIANL